MLIAVDVKLYGLLGENFVNFFAQGFSGKRFNNVLAYLGLHCQDNIILLCLCDDHDKGYISQISLSSDMFK